MQSITETNIEDSKIMTMPDRYARCIMASKRISWDIDNDVIRNREFDYGDKFLPDGLSLVNELEFLTPDSQRFLSQIQGRTYANIFGLVERFINAKVLEVSQKHSLGDQIALEALIRFSEEELKHQELFRRLELMAGKNMPEGYAMCAEPNEVAKIVLGKSTWAVLGLTCHIELFTLQHYKQSIKNSDGLSALYKDVFLFHWKEESQHAILDEIEWREENTRITDKERDESVDDLIELVGAVDGILQAQSAADTSYFIENAEETFNEDEKMKLAELVLKAYRWQYIVSGIQESKFVKILTELTTDSQMERVNEALSPLM